jgi:hypothetical protein
MAGGSFYQSVDVAERLGNENQPVGDLDVIGILLTELFVDDLHAALDALEVRHSSMIPLPSARCLVLVSESFSDVNALIESLGDDAVRELEYLIEMIGRAMNKIRECWRQSS